MRVRHAVARFLPHALVEDCVQDVAVAALAGIRAFRGDSEFAAWLLSIARNRAITACSVLRRQRARTGEALCAETVLAADEPDLAALRELHALLRRQPRPYRQPLWLRYVHGCSAAEIADRIGTTEGAVRVVLCRGLRRLRGGVAAPSLE